MSPAAETVEVIIDGQKVQVPPQTTIYDAALKAGIRIPVLCHREHMNPVAVCRVCVVDTGERVLAPACYRQCGQLWPNKDGQRIVGTRHTSQRVATSVRVLTEMLVGDNMLTATPVDSEPNELLALAQELGLSGSHYPIRKIDRGRDDSSLVIAVDHNACILCDRCIRGCNDIRGNEVLGRRGKGYTAGIAFDLHTPMGDSSCVSCGECMVSCPTGALTFRRPVHNNPWVGINPPPTPVRAHDLARHPLFSGVSQKFLEWNEGSIVRRTYRKGEIICREREFGSTAFYIEQGRVEVFISAPLAHIRSRKGGSSGIFGLARRLASSLVSRGDDRREEEDIGRRFIHVDAPVALQYDRPAAVLDAGNIFGEMTCMNHYPRSATVRAQEDCVVLEMQRNVLYILQRNKKSKAMLDDIYRKRTVDTHMRSVNIFSELITDDRQFQTFVDFLRNRVELIRFNPGEVIFNQGETADSVYLVRIGFVRVSQNHTGGERVVTYIGPGGYFGEIGIMSDLPEIKAMAPEGVRTATCAALDHVDVVQIKKDDFLEVLKQFPQVREKLKSLAIQHLRENEQQRQQLTNVSLGEFLRQGLMNARSLLVLDLEKCTRCDECTKACADAHSGVTRLIREGLRFDKWLVASSCRACLDPYCMVGCPVDSIHRGRSGEMVIEDWCIGCGKCADNCPYGNINMHSINTVQEDPMHPGVKVPVLQSKATMCDLCLSVDGQPSCVYACPHDAAHRMNGDELRKLVTLT